MLRTFPGTQGEGIRARPLALGEGRGAGPRSPSGVGLPRLQGSPDILPSACCTRRKLKPRNKSSLLRSPSEFVGKVGLKSMGSDGLAWSFLGLPRRGGPGFELVQLGLPCT